MWQEISYTLEDVALYERYRAGTWPILMVHGIGPGTTGRTNFEPILERLPARFALHVIDLAGFGDSDRITSLPYFDVAFWVRQIGAAIAKLLQMHGRPPLLVGNSVGGALVLKAASEFNDIAQVVVIGAPAQPHATQALRDFWQAPRDAAALAAAMRPMTASMAPPPAKIVADRYKMFEGDYGTYFSTMLADPEKCLADAVLTQDEAATIQAHVTFLHGREDRACPARAMLDELLPMLPAADCMVFGNCGHNVIYERTEDVLATIERLERLDAS